jgi:hypothetical protein
MEWWNNGKGEKIESYFQYPIFQYSIIPKEISSFLNSQI